MSKSTITRLILTLVGIGLVIFLFQLPKGVVEDEKNLAQQKPSTPQQQVRVNSGGEEHEISASSQERIKRLRKSYLSEQDSGGFSKKRLIFADSLAQLYVDNFMFDSAAALLEGTLTADDQPLRMVFVGKEYLRMCKIVSSTNAERATSYGERAIDLFDKTLVLRPDLTSAAVNKAVAIVYRNTSQRKPPIEGFKLLKELIELHPENTEARMNLGELYAQRGQLQTEWLAKGIEQFSAVLQYEPENTTALMYIIECNIGLGETAKASEYLQTLKKINNVVADPFLTDRVGKYERELKE